MNTILALAIAAMLSANNATQGAIDRDICRADETLLDTTAARATLSADDKRTYDKVRRKLGNAYAASHQGDAALENVRKRFCRAVENR